MDLGLKDRVVVVSAVDNDDSEACAAMLRAEGAIARVADSPSVAAAEVGAALREHGRVDGVVMYLPAGADSTVLVSAVDDLYGSWSAVEHIVAAYRAATPTMIERGWGRMVTVMPSGVKWVADASDELGAMAGLGVLGMHKAVVADVARYGIAANAVLRSTDSNADEVAATVGFLLSEHSGYLQGVTISLDGAISPAMF